MKNSLSASSSSEAAEALSSSRRGHVLGTAETGSGGNGHGSVSVQGLGSVSDSGHGNVSDRGRGALSVKAPGSVPNVKGPGGRGAGGNGAVGKGVGGNGAQSGLLAVRTTLQDRLRFVRAFLRSPASVGALGPSSTSLARAILANCNLEASGTVVELGPGTGVFTRLILSRIGQKTTFFALELDPEFAASLRRRFPTLTVYNDSAERIPEYLLRHGRRKADYIVSGLPWATLPLGVQDRIFGAVLRSLEPGGVFATFGYVHARWFPNAQRFRRRLKEQFSAVHTSRVVWGNFPPAFVYRCVR